MAIWLTPALQTPALHADVLAVQCPLKALDSPRGLTQEKAHSRHYDLLLLLLPLLTEKAQPAYGQVQTGSEA